MAFSPKLPSTNAWLPRWFLAVELISGTMFA
jgi:hypothetical protein